MRDIDLTDDTDTAYTEPGAAGVLAATIATDPAFTDAKAYVVPSLGGDFGPCNALVLGGQADGGAALLDADVTVTMPAAPVPQPAPTGAGGLAWNNTSFDNLYPWINNPGTGLDFNNPNPPPG